MRFNMDIHQINQISKDIYETILDFPEQNVLLNSIVDHSVAYVLLTELSIGNFSWQNFNISGFSGLKGMARNFRGDFLVSTQEFIEKYQNYSWQYAIQLAEIPPDYFEFSKISGKQRYNILKQCGFTFIVQSQSGGGDYVSLISPSESLIKKAIVATTA